MVNAGLDYVTILNTAKNGIVLRMAPDIYGDGEGAWVPGLISRRDESHWVWKQRPWEDFLLDGAGLCLK